MIRHFKYRCKEDVEGSTSKLAEVYSPPGETYTFAEVIARLISPATFMPSIIHSLIVVAVMLFLGGCAASRTTQPKPAAPRTEASGVKAFGEIISDTTLSDGGLFAVHRAEDKLYFEIPDSLFGRDMLIVSRIAQAPTDLHPFIAGGASVNEQVVRWEKRDRQVLLRVGQYVNVASDTLPVALSVQANNFAPVLQAFKIEAYGRDSAGVLIDATELFKSDIAAIGLPSSMRTQFKVRRLDVARSYIESAKSFPLNVEVRHVLTYDAGEPPSHASTNTISVEMSQSMVLLPDDLMAKRSFDPRVGWFTIEQVDFGIDEPKAASRRYIRRWRLEPSDADAYARGELVEPVKPIVYYIDAATPDRWRPYVRQGIEDWQRAFEAAGFKKAILARDPPSDDPDWSPEDVRYSSVRWVANTTRNAMGPSVSDPRTGEIIESDIIWYHNHLRSYRNRLIVETGAANEEIDSIDLPDELLGETVRQVIAHEVGHALGLPHNMIASSAYPVDSLRSGSFTRAMGIAPTIMDYARQNYIAQPGDDVRFIRQIGPYDLYAINWGYRLIPENEKAVLDRWILEKAGDPIYRYGSPGADPRAQTEDLGNDPVLASSYGMANLRRVLPRLTEWTSRAGQPYDDLEELYGELVSQWMRYVGHVAGVIGGVYETRKTADQEGVVFEAVPEVKQRQAMQFLANEVFATPDWLLDEDLLRRIEGHGAVDRMRRIQVSILNGLLDPDRLQRLIEAEAFAGGDAYALIELLDDVRGIVWSELARGEAVDTYRRNLQRGYLERMATLASPENAQTDLRAFARGQLRTLRSEAERALRRTTDRPTQYHLQDTIARIEQTLDPRPAR